MTKLAINSNAFSEYTPESCYWAGFLAADGCISPGHNKKGPTRVRIYLQGKDIEHLRKFKRFLQSEHKVAIHEKFNGRCSFEFSDLKIAQDLGKYFGIFPRKSLTYEKPEGMPLEFAKYFIRGYFDGDGTLCEYLTHRSCKYKSLVSALIGTPNFLNWVKPIIYSAIGKTNIVKNNVHVNGFSEIMGLSTKDTMKFLTWIYEDSTEETRLDRKYLKYHKIVVEGIRELNLEKSEDNGIVHPSEKSEDNGVCMEVPLEVLLFN